MAGPTRRVLRTQRRHSAGPPAAAVPGPPHLAVLAARQEAVRAVGLHRQLVGPAAVRGQAARLHRAAAGALGHVRHPHLRRPAQHSKGGGAVVKDSTAGMAANS